MSSIKAGDIIEFPSTFEHMVRCKVKGIREDKRYVYVDTDSSGKIIFSKDFLPKVKVVKSAK